MTFPSIPPLGSTSWYAWAQAVHGKAEYALPGAISNTAPGDLPAGGVWFTSRVDTTAPTVPTSVVATADANSINVTWNPSTDDSGALAGYNVRRGGTLLASLVATTAYDDTTATPGTPYTYTVTAIDPFGNESAQSTASNSATVSSDTTPTVPTSGLIADFAANTLTQSGGVVTAWPNRVSGGADLVLTGAPAYSTADASGKASVIFDGVDDYGTAAIGTTARPYSRVFVGRLITTAVSKTLTGTANGSTNRGILSTAASGGVWNMYGGVNLPHTAAYDSAKHHFAEVFAGTAASRFDVDGTTVTGTGGTESGEGLRIAANPAATVFAHTEVFRVLAYNRALTAQEIIDIRTAHQTYYGLP
jgi:hypothetical protein